MSAYTWVRRALDVSQLPRVKLNNIQDLPGAKRKVWSPYEASMCSLYFSVSGWPQTKSRSLGVR